MNTIFQLTFPCTYLIEWSHLFLGDRTLEQLSLFFKHDETYLKRLFEKTSGKSVVLTLTDNSSRILSVKTKGEALSVRVHRIFLEASGEVLNEVAEFVTKRKGSTPLIRNYIRERSYCLRKATHRKLNVMTLGRHFDLASIYDSVNHTYFEGSVASPITWGAKTSPRAVRRRTLGSYCSLTNTIRINPVLDNVKVPSYFVEFIVYHEMLHAHMGLKEKNGRRSVHSREFREREKIFRDYERAMAWERINRI